MLIVGDPGPVITVKRIITLRDNKISGKRQGSTFCYIDYYEPFREPVKKCRKI